MPPLKPKKTGQLRAALVADDPPAEAAGERRLGEVAQEGDEAALGAHGALDVGRAGGAGAHGPQVGAVGQLGQDQPG